MEMKQRKSKRIHTRLTAAAAVAVALGLAACARADTIYSATGARIECKQIVQADWDNVVYELAGGARSNIEGYKVVRLERPSSTLSRIVSLIESGEFEAAEDQIRKAKNFGLQPWEKAKLGFLEGQLYLDWSSEDPSKADQAVKAFESYRAENKKDFYVPEATYQLGRALMAAGKPNASLQYFQELSTYGGTKGIWGYRANIGQALAIIEAVVTTGERQKIPEARSLLGRVISDRSAPEDVKEEAIVVRAKSFNAVGDHAQAISEITRGFLRRNGNLDYDENYARACNVMGDAYRLQGGTANFQKAEIWYLRTTCFFRRYPGEYRHAVNNLVTVYEQLGQKDRASEWKAKTK